MMGHDNPDESDEQAASAPDAPDSEAEGPDGGELDAAQQAVPITDSVKSGRARNLWEKISFWRDSQQQLRPPGGHMPGEGHPGWPPPQNHVWKYDELRAYYRQTMYRHQIRSFSGALSYHGIFAVLSLLFLVLTGLFLFGIEQMGGDWLTSLLENLPDEIEVEVESSVEAIVQTGLRGASISALIALGGAIWGLSRGFRELRDALNTINEDIRITGMLTRYVIAILIAIVFATVIVGVLVLITLGGYLVDTVIVDEGLVHEGLAPLLSAATLVLSLGLLVFAFAFIYMLGPDRRRSWRAVLPGAIIGGLTWLVFAQAFWWFVATFGTYSTYGALAGLFGFLLFLYYSAYILLGGAEFNAIYPSLSHTIRVKRAQRRGAK